MNIGIITVCCFTIYTWNNRPLNLALVLNLKRSLSDINDEDIVKAGRMTATGKSEFISKADNETAGGRSTNRRTEIVLAPRMGQFFKLLEASEILN